ncbi:hypothetical protein F0L68_04070 [Solihabitans fulvus]|uniref:Uncharacterized protein n=1 Tax=Solihabitans fulvus TaxID=1892852 RepID=A0A5B2XQP9_9PSEU|nr:VOC family protein [Solihabitans fulvus]KAA2265753.1 hypothetical protein F0L68_04070 [Solihabitans fulvus]
MPHSPVRGLRCIDLRTTNPIATAEHYQQLLGWIALPTGDGAVDCWVGDRLAARIHPTNTGEQPGWHLIFGGATPRALTDPTGTTATTDSGRVQHGPWAPEPRHGEPCWTELLTNTDTDHYWTTELGWHTRQPTPATPFTLYETTGGNDTTKPIAGRLLLDHDLAARVGTGWMCYFAVTDTNEAAAINHQLGGTVLLPPQDVPTGRITTIADPTGNICTLLQNPTGWGGTWTT